LSKVEQAIAAKQAAAGGAAVTGLGDAALVQHVSMLVSKMLQKAGMAITGGGAGALGNP
jgi:hypothetical protein